MKKLTLFLSSLFGLILILLASGYGYVYFQSQPVNRSGTESEKIRFEVHSGDSVKKIASKLKEQGIIRNEKLFYIFARKPEFLKIVYFHSENISSNYVMKSGMYYPSADMTLPEIFALLSSGQQEYVTVSIPEGFTISKIAGLLEEKGICSRNDFISVCHDTSFLMKNGISLESAEGFLFPDTYFFVPSTPAKNIAEDLISTFFKKISTLIDVDTITNREINDIVVLSSIVEREYRVKEEAPLIASVFKNRLRHNIGLYSCATVVYILTEIEGRPHPSRILIEDTKIDNPYNTYKWAGLPPGAISSPGLTALDAVINAPKTNYYFFQVKDAAKGTHVFTSTFDEHIENHNLNTK